MRERVLDEWLEQHGRYLRLERLGRDVARENETRSEPHLLEVEIEIEALQLHPEADLAFRPLIESQPQQVAEPNEHRLGGPRGFLARARRCRSAC